VSERVVDFREVHEAFTPEAAQAQAERCVQCAHPGCVEECPVGSPIEEWMQLVAEGRFQEAARIARESNAIPEICARLCPRDHLCERGCVLGGPSEPVCIGALEQFLQDYSLGVSEAEDRLAEPNGRRIAVVGAGAAGLACADELSRRGYSVTLFDSGTDPGGGLVRGTASFRLDPAVVQRRVVILRERGVEFRLDAPLGESVSLAGLRKEFDAVFVGLEARQARLLQVPGAHLNGVTDGLALMARITSGVRPDWNNRRVVVVGDEDLAIDCARSAVRCGAASVIVISAAGQADMGCSRRDFDCARDEGVRFVWEQVPVSIHGDAARQVTEVQTVRVARLPMEDGRGSRMGLVPGTEETLGADIVVVALGFDRQAVGLPGDFVELGADGLGEVLVDRRQMTHLPGVFAGGEVVRGPCDVVHAIRDARQAATGIGQYLGIG
jgi:glutamate synthase (NADPH/NADH) small chain